MKKYRIITIVLVLVSIFNMGVYAEENDASLYTQNSDISCSIDGIYVESYSINDFMYLPLNKLTEYGFEIINTENEILLGRKKIFYFDGDYSKSQFDNGNLPVFENPIPVMINNNRANTYIVNDQIVIQADELTAFGEVKWENRQVVISIVINELLTAFKNAENLITEKSINGPVLTKGQQDENGVWNGIVRHGEDGFEHTGYMINGEFEGVVYGHREHKPYLAELTTLMTVKDGKKNGYCWYMLGYNNKPEYPGTTIMVSGIYENNKLKNGSYKEYTDFDLNTATYNVVDFKEQIIHSTNKYNRYTDANVVYNAERIVFDSRPVVEKERISIPLRGLFEKMGASVDWNGEDKSVTVSMDGKEVYLRVDYHEATVDGETKYMDIPPRLSEGRVMVPIRFLTEELGLSVAWDNETKTVSVTR